MQHPPTEEPRAGGARPGTSNHPVRDGAGGLNSAGGFGGGNGPVGMGMGPGGAAGLNLRNLRTFTSFRYPAFRLYYGAMLGQMAAMNMQMLVRALLVFRLTESPGALGLMAMANAAPMLFFSLFGGVMAERVQKKNVLLWGQAASGVISLVVALSLSFNIMTDSSWWILIVAALAQGTVMGLMMPSRQAIIADLVGGEELMNAVALNTFGMNGLRLMAPAIAGFLVDFFGGGGGIAGFASVYYTMTALYVVAVLFIIPMPKAGTIALKGRGALSEMVDGFRYVRKDTTILVILIFVLIVTLLSMSYMFLLPVFTESILKVSASKLGLLISSSGIGAMVGSIILASLPNKKRGVMLIFGSMIMGMSLVGFSFSTVYWLSIVMIIVVGFGQTARMTLGNTLLQYYVKNEYRGRVMSMMMMEFGMTSFVVALAGFMAELIGVQWAVGGMAMVLVVVCLYFLAAVPHLRKLE